MRYWRIGRLHGPTGQNLKVSIMGKERILGLLRLRSTFFTGCQMGELNRGERLQIMLTHAELRIVDTWRFAKRMPSRAAAIRELLKRGMAAEGFAEVEDGQKSKDFSVLSGEPAE
jgi:hypothetical protein